MESKPIDFKEVSHGYINFGNFKLDPRIRLDAVLGVLLSLLGVVGMWYNLKGDVRELQVISEARYAYQQQHNADARQALSDSQAQIQADIRELREEIINGRKSK